MVNLGPRPDAAAAYRRFGKPQAARPRRRHQRSRSARARGRRPARRRGRPPQAVQSGRDVGGARGEDRLRPLRPAVVHGRNGAQGREAHSRGSRAPRFSPPPSAGPPSSAMARANIRRIRSSTALKSSRGIATAAAIQELRPRKQHRSDFPRFGNPLRVSLSSLWCNKTIPEPNSDPIWKDSAAQRNELRTTGPVMD